MSGAGEGRSRTVNLTNACLRLTNDFFFTEPTWSDRASNERKTRTLGNFSVTRPGWETNHKPESYNKRTPTVMDFCDRKDISIS